MNDSSSAQVEAILRLAGEEALSFQHNYIGTEHLLLGLMREDSGVAATVLRSHSIDLASLRHEIEQLVRYGPTEVTQMELPLTPRARQALEFAEEDARVVGQSAVDTEHVLTGLLREPDGVAGLVLRKFGLELSKLGAEVLKIRLLQMKIVERVVRPLRAHIHRKRKIRDELLVHLSAIYDEELGKYKNPGAAVEAAAKRFGNPTERTNELQTTVPPMERWEAALEPIFGWRPPESAVKWMCRLALQISTVLVLMLVLGTVLAVREHGWSYSAWLTIRPFTAAMSTGGILIALSGICYFKMRDCIFGAFGSRKSWPRAITWAALLTVCATICGLVFNTVAYGRFSAATAAFYPWLATCIVWAVTVFVFARIFGPQEIRDTTWALLELNDQPFAA